MRREGGKKKRMKEIRKMEQRRSGDGAPIIMARAAKGELYIC